MFIVGLILISCAAFGNGTCTCMLVSHLNKCPPLKTRKIWFVYIMYLHLDEYINITLVPYVLMRMECPIS